VVIYHFNRLIRNRFVWGAFAVIIAFAFVSVDSCTTSSGGRTDAGTLDGRKVPAQVYRSLEHYIRQTDRRQEAPPQAVLYTQTWERLAAAYTAKQAGLADHESEATIQSGFRGGRANPRTPPFKEPQSKRAAPRKGERRRYVRKEARP